uniref:Glycine-rich cell wall structural protein-like isoform X2 n=1 Tax=Crassostrea virginica TaxID=6565 RepID=A0A8B8F0N8_CRAVI|nr:glycine-rich cell wall structural protein-like isoform X2 [Crassostrea virginica]
MQGLAITLLAAVAFLATVDGHRYRGPRFINLGITGILAPVNAGYNRNTLSQLSTFDRISGSSLSSSGSALLAGGFTGRGASIGVSSVYPGVRTTQIYRGFGPLSGGIQSYSDFGTGPYAGAGPYDGDGPLDGLAPYDGQGPLGSIAPYDGQGPLGSIAPYDGQGPLGSIAPYDGQGPLGGSGPYDEIGVGGGGLLSGSVGPYDRPGPYDGEGPLGGSGPYDEIGVGGGGLLGGLSGGVTYREQYSRSYGPFDYDRGTGPYGYDEEPYYDGIGGGLSGGEVGLGSGFGNVGGLTTIRTSRYASYPGAIYTNPYYGGDVNYNSYNGQGGYFYDEFNGDSLGGLGGGFGEGGFGGVRLGGGEFGGEGFGGGEFLRVGGGAGGAGGGAGGAGGFGVARNSGGGLDVDAAAAASGLRGQGSILGDPYITTNV